MESQQVARLADVGEAMADVTGPGLVQYPRLQMWDVHCLCQQTCHVIDCITVARGNIDGLTGNERVLHRQTKGARDIAHMDEVALLLAVFKDKRLLAVQQASTKIGEDASIGIGERLARTKHIEQPQRDYFHAVCGTKDLTASFLNVFGQCVDRREINLFRFIGWHRHEWAATRR